MLVKKIILIHVQYHELRVQADAKRKRDSAQPEDRAQPSLMPRKKGNLRAG